jgi:hypothetical protein
MRQLTLPGGRETITRSEWHEEICFPSENTHDKTVNFFQHED